jgi:hypothetical protein
VSPANLTRPDAHSDDAAAGLGEGNNVTYGGKLHATRPWAVLVERKMRSGVARQDAADRALNGDSRSRTCGTLERPTEPLLVTDSRVTFVRLQRIGNLSGRALRVGRRSDFEKTIEHRDAIFGMSNSHCETVAHAATCIAKAPIEYARHRRAHRQSTGLTWRIATPRRSEGQRLGLPVARQSG